MNKLSNLDLIKQTYPNLIAEQITSIQPINLSKEDCKQIFCFKEYKIGWFSRLLCKLSIHRYKLVHCWLKGFVLQCDCGKYKPIIKK